MAPACGIRQLVCFRVRRNRPRCPVCAGQMKKIGTTSKGTTRWRCKSPNCGNSTTRTRTDLSHTRDFKAFHAYITCTATLAEVARQQGVSRWTLDRRFTPFWPIEVPNPVSLTASTIRSSSTAHIPLPGACSSPETMTKSSPGIGRKAKPPTPTRSFETRSQNPYVLSLTAGKARTPLPKRAGPMHRSSAAWSMPSALSVATPPLNHAPVQAKPFTHSR